MARNTDQISQAIADGVAESAQWLRGIRRDIHRHPELRFEEFQTSARLKKEMRELGFDLREGLAGTGLTAHIGGSAPSTGEVKTVALRADLDALPVQEETGLPFASEVPGIMHACGHDAHTAVVATMARVVARSQVLRDALPGNLVFLFQPAEEGGMGAKHMVEAGALEDPHVDAILGFHVYPVLRTGEISVYNQFSHASADCFELVFTGKGGHAGYPHLSKDPITPTAEMLLALRTLVTRETDPLKPAVLSVGAINGGHTNNVTPESISIRGTLRCLDEDVRAHLKQRLQELAEGFAGAHRATAQVTWDKGCPATLNDSRISTVFHREATGVLPEGGVHELDPGMGAEDFGIYTQHIPGALFRLGCTAPTTMEWYPLHNPRFQVDEDSLELAAQILLRSAYTLLAEGFPAQA